MNEKIGINQRAKEYVMIIINGKKVHRHRFVWEKFYGKIPDGYFIHHINGNKKDDRIKNLQLVSRKEHAEIHSKILKAQI